MFKNLARLARYAAPIALAAVFSAIPADAQKPRVNVVNSTNAPLKLNLTSDTTTVSACSDSGTPQVRLTADARRCIVELSYRGATLGSLRRTA